MSAEELRHRAERAEAERDFLARDQAPLERRYHWAQAEVDALRQLVADFVEAVAPNLPQMSFADRPESWQYRAVRAMAGCPIASDNTP